MIFSAVRSGTLEGLQEIVRQSELSGANRHVALLRTDRLPPRMARPHHVRLARQAMHSLLGADRAQIFDLPYGRIAIVWRNGGKTELTQVRDSLRHLLTGDPAADPDSLLSLYDLPDQAIWFLDQLSEGPELSVQPAVKGTPLDLTILARLESGLAQADLSRFVRRRMVVTLPHESADSSVSGSVAWEERVVATDELASGICPEHEISGDQWLFRRLTRTLDRRMLVMLSTGREMTGCRTYAINLNVTSILSPEFLRFDEALPVTLRGEIILNLTIADILADLSVFTFARNFAHARQYRMSLADATLASLSIFDPFAAGLDVVKVNVCPEIKASASSLSALLPPNMPTVITGLDRPSELRWARQNGFNLGQGYALSP